MIGLLQTATRLLSSRRTSVWSSLSLTGMPNSFNNPTSVLYSRSRRVKSSLAVTAAAEPSHNDDSDDEDDGEGEGRVVPTARLFNDHHLLITMISMTSLSTEGNLELLHLGFYLMNGVHVLKEKIITFTTKCKVTVSFLSN